MKPLILVNVRLDIWGKIVISVSAFINCHFVRLIILDKSQDANTDYGVKTAKTPAPAKIMLFVIALMETVAV